MHVAKTNPLLATVATVSPKSTSGTTPSSSDFSAALSKLFSSHSSGSNNKSDAGSGNSSKHPHDQDSDTSSSAHTGSKGNQDTALPQQPVVTMSMLGRPAATVFAQQQPTDAPSTNASATTSSTADAASLTDLTAPASLLVLTAPVSLRGLTGDKSMPVAGQQGTFLSTIQSGAAQPAAVQFATPLADSTQSIPVEPTSYALAGPGNVFAVSDNASGNTNSSVNMPADVATDSNSTDSAVAPVSTSSSFAAGTSTPIPATSNDSNTLFGLSQDDTDAAPVSGTPTLPVNFGPGSDDPTAAIPVPVAANPQAPMGTLPTFTPRSPVTAVGAVTANADPNTPALPTNIVSTSATSDMPATASKPVSQQPVSSPLQAGGHNQIAVPHRPVVTSPAPTTPPVNGLGPRNNINNGLIQAPASEPTGPKHADTPAVSAPVVGQDQNTSVTGAGDSAVASTAFAANGTAAMDNGSTSSDSSGSSNSGDRSKDDVVVAVAAASAQPAVMMPAFIPVTTAPVQAADISVAATSSSPSASSPSTSSAVGASELETPSISDVKSVINTSKLMQTINQSEMRVGMRSAEFGDINIRAQATHDSILTQIQVDHPELASSLANHVPDMQARLASHGNVEVQVNPTQSHSGSSSATGSGSSYQGNSSQAGSNGGSQQDGGGSRAYFSTSYSSAGYANSALPVAAITNTLQNAGYDGRLDLQA